MVPLALFADRSFSGLSIFTFLLYAALGGLLLLLPYVLIREAGYSSTAAGAALLPFPLTMGVLSRYAGGSLADRFGTRALLTFGSGLVAVGFALFSLMPSQGLSYGTHVLPGLVALALGMSQAVAPLTSAVLTAAGDDFAGVASGVNNAISPGRRPDRDGASGAGAAGRGGGSAGRLRRGRLGRRRIGDRFGGGGLGDGTGAGDGLTGLAIGRILPSSSYQGMRRCPRT